MRHQDLISTRAVKLSPSLVSLLAILIGLNGCSGPSFTGKVSSLRTTGPAMVTAQNGSKVAMSQTHATKISTPATEVIIGAGALTVDATVSVGGYKKSDAAYIKNELGIKNGEVASVGVTHVQASTAEKLAQPMTIKIKLENSIVHKLSLGISAAFLQDPNYFVVYSFKQVDGTTVTGLISSKQIKVADGFAIFQVFNFGVYELFRSDEAAPDSVVLANGQMSAFGKDITVNKLSTSLLVTGTDVEVEGDHFDASTRVMVLGQQAEVTKRTRDVLAFKVPGHGAFGKGEVQVKNRYKTHKLPVFYKGSKNDLPMVDAAPANVCKSITYYDTQGVKQQGQKICVATDVDSCSEAKDQDCLLTGENQRIDPATLRAQNIAAGHRIGGVTGTLTHADLTTLCTADGQTDCRASASLPAVNPQQIDASAIKAGVIIGGTTGTLKFPAKQTCENGRMGNCTIPSSSNELVAVDSDELKEGLIRNGISIGNVQGKYPSASYPLSDSTTADLSAANFGTKLGSSNEFQFFDRFGTRFTAKGDDNFKAGLIAEGATIFGQVGSFKLAQPLQGTAWDYRIGYGNGKIKTNCRSLVLSGDDANPGNNVAGHFTREPTVNPWGHQRYACLSEGWKALDNGCDPSQGKGCRYQDLKTKKTWYIAGNQNPMRANYAMQHCASLNTGGFSDWRVPGQKEAYQAIINGLSSSFPGDFRESLEGKVYWSSTVSAGNAQTPQQRYWFFHLTSGIGARSENATANAEVICVR